MRIIKCKYLLINEIHLWGVKWWWRIIVIDYLYHSSNQDIYRIDKYNETSSLFLNTAQNVYHLSSKISSYFDILYLLFYLNNFLTFHFFIIYITNSFFLPIPWYYFSLRWDDIYILGSFGIHTQNSPITDVICKTINFPVGISLSWIRSANYFSPKYTFNHYYKLCFFSSVEK